MTSPPVASGSWLITVMMHTGRTGSVAFDDFDSAFVAYSAAAAMFLTTGSGGSVNITNGASGAFAARSMDIESIALTGPVE